MSSSISNTFFFLCLATAVNTIVEVTTISVYGTTCEAAWLENVVHLQRTSIAIAHGKLENDSFFPTIAKNHSENCIGNCKKETQAHTQCKRWGQVFFVFFQITYNRHVWWWKTSLPYSVVQKKIHLLMQWYSWEIITVKHLIRYDCIFETSVEFWIKATGKRSCNKFSKLQIFYLYWKFLSTLIVSLIN